MRSNTAKTGVRYVTNTVSMAARQDGYRAAAAVAFRLVVSETRKLPRLARLAVSASDSPAKHPTGYSEKIVQALDQLPVKVTPYRIDPESFYAHLRSFEYPKAYAAGPLDEGGNRENKLLEYFVSLELFDLGDDPLHVSGIREELVKQLA